MKNNQDLLTTELILKLDRCLDKLEAWLPTPLQAPDLNVFDNLIFNTDEKNHFLLSPIECCDDNLNLPDLLHIDANKKQLQNNIEALLSRKAVNQALLWGPRGTGKSSLIKALVKHYSKRGLRCIEIQLSALKGLSKLIELIQSPANQAYSFIIFIDDLSFENINDDYRALKTIIDGSIASLPKNALICATSNRRHIVKERQADNLETTVAYRDGELELHHADSVEETISLSERFGLWLSFQPFSQSEYLNIARYWLNNLNSAIDFDEKIKQRALQYSLERGSRSGRIARQFAILVSSEHY